MVFDKWTQRQVLVTVRTYPTPAAKGVEVSCTAGVTAEGTWIRLFPIPYRRLPDKQRFRKYDWLDVRVTKSSDYRPESYKVDIDSIRVVSHMEPDQSWQARKEILAPLQSHCLCCLAAERDKHGSPTLGFFKPKKIRRLVIEPEDEDWTPQERTKLRQLTLFDNQPVVELQKIPFRFQYHFDCDEESCRSHTLSCTDWEMSESYRQWVRKYGREMWQEKFRQKYEKEMIEKYDTHFFVGTLAPHPNRWNVIGLFYPPF